MVGIQSVQLLGDPNLAEPQSLGVLLKAKAADPGQILWETNRGYHKDGSLSIQSQSRHVMFAVLLDYHFLSHYSYYASTVLYVSLAICAAMRIDQHKPREVAKNQMLDNNTSCAIREISSGNWFQCKRFGPIFEKNLL